MAIREPNLIIAPRNTTAQENTRMPMIIHLLMQTRHV
jgi:hypothetical protein